MMNGSKWVGGDASSTVSWVARLVVSLSVLAAGMVVPALSQVEVGQIDQVLPGQQGIRFHSTAKVRSVSGRLDFRGRVIVTFVGLHLAPGLQRLFSEDELVDMDGSGLLRGMVLESSELGSGTSLVIATLETRVPTAFRVSVEGEDVAVALEEKVGVLGEPNAGSLDPISGRRVLTAADLEPIPGDVQNSVSSSGAGSQRGVALTTVSSVNLRPTPTLESTPLMVLPAKTPVYGIGAKGNWRRVALGELEGWVDGAFLVERAAPVPEATMGPSDQERAEEFDLGDPGGWEDRLAESLRRREEPPSWQGDAALVSGRELSNRERALQEATSRRLETAQHDLREARVESAELRIDLARALQRLEEVQGRLEVAEARVVELEGLLVVLREDAVSSRAQLERSSAKSRVLRKQLTQTQAERDRLDDRFLVAERERNDAKSAFVLLQVEADALREALRGAEEDLAVVAKLEAISTPASTPGSPLPTVLDTGPEGEARSIVIATESSAPELELSRETILAVESTLQAWVKAWSDRDVATYLGFYSERFSPSQGSLRAWKKRRQDRLHQPDWIEVEIERLTVSPLRPAGDPSQKWARAEFQQSYRSDNYQDVVEKVVLLVLEPSGWRIVRERAELVVSAVLTAP